MGALAAVGGFEIATMAGFYVGAAESRLPVMVDGFITFIHVDRNAKRIPHGIVLDVTEPEEIALQEKAKELQIARRVKG